MTSVATAEVSDPPAVRATAAVRPGRLVFALLALVVAPDQVLKWWAWRNVADVSINFGGDPIVGKSVGGWYADPTLGALLDVVSTGLLGLVVILLLRRLYPAVLLVPAALTTDGWISNLLDRLGLHYITAPGSVRGAVDFIHVGSYYYNLADVFIVAGTVCFVVALGYRLLTGRPLTTGSVPVRRLHWVPAALAGAAVLAMVVTAVGLGAAHYGGLETPSIVAE